MAFSVGGIELTRKRCSICSKRFSRRFCASRHEDVCTRCCGITRSKKVCPRECEFATKTMDKGTFYGKEVQVQQTYCDTLKELKESRRLQLEAWCDKPCKGLGGKTPMEVSKTPEGRKKLREIFAEMETENKEIAVLHGNKPIDYFPAKVKLGLEKCRSPAEREADFEETVEIFIEGVRNRVEAVMGLVSQELKRTGIADAFSGVTGFEVTRSALSDCGNFALVEIEAWHEDYSMPPETFELKKKEAGWRIISHADMDIEGIINSR